MADIRQWTDKELELIEREMMRIYRDAQKNLMRDWYKFMDKAAKRIERYEVAYAEALATGDRDAIADAKERLQNVKKRETFQNERYRNMVDDITENLAKINQKALDVANGKMPSIYAGNYNDSAIDAKNLGLDFSIVNENAVRNLTNELPNKVVQIAKDRTWNNKGITSGVLQGIIQGDSMPKIAKRLEHVFDNNKASAIRNARTMVTQAENLGHLDGYKKLADEGVVSKQQWVAVGDSRTRDWHLSMHGQERDVDEPFEDGLGNKLRYPADRTAPAETVYNCRCGTKLHIVGFRKADGTIEYIDYDRSMDEESMRDIQVRIEQERRAKVAAEKEARKNAKAVTQKTQVELDELDNLKKSLGDDNYKEFAERITKNADITNLYNRYGNKATLYKESNGGYFYGNSVHYSFSKYKQIDKYTTLSHEYGHYFDAHMTLDIGDKVSFNEIEKINDAIHLGYFKKYPSSCDEYLGALKKDKEIIREMLKDQKQIDDINGNHASNGVQDLADGLFSTCKNNVFGWGHGERYYNRKYNMLKSLGEEKELKKVLNDLGYDVSNQTKVKRVVRQFETTNELWANQMAALTVGGDALKYIEKYTPNTLKVLKKIIGGLK